MVAWGSYGTERIPEVALKHLLHCLADYVGGTDCGMQRPGAGIGVAMQTREGSGQFS